MRFVIPPKANRNTEALQAGFKGVRVKSSEAKRTVIDGPFAESKELIAGLRAHTAAKR